MVQGKGCDWGAGGGGGRGCGVMSSSMETQEKIVILYNYQYVKELAYAQHEYIKLWMHTGSLKSTRGRKS